MKTYSLLKRSMDLLLALVGLVLLMLCLLCLAPFLVYLHGRPLFIFQKRIGKGLTEFKCWKLKSMKGSVDVSDRIEHRLTPLGKWVRNVGIDELPQCWNIMKGEMSFVGPRPLPIEYLPLVEKINHPRFLNLPGLTGWAQVKGRNTSTWKKRFEYDQFYVENQRIGFDVKILWLTLKGMFHKSNTDRIMPKLTEQDVKEL